MVRFRLCYSRTYKQTRSVVSGKEQCNNNSSQRQFISFAFSRGRVYYRRGLLRRCVCTPNSFFRSLSGQSHIHTYIPIVVGPPNRNFCWPRVRVFKVRIWIGTNGRAFTSCHVCVVVVGSTCFNAGLHFIRIAFWYAIITSSAEDVWAI